MVGRCHVKDSSRAVAVRTLWWWFDLFRRARTPHDVCVSCVVRPCVMECAVGGPGGPCGGWRQLQI